MPSRALGIDLGATRAALARIDEVGRSALVRDARGDLLIPSVVYFEDDEILYGRMAELAAARDVGRAAEFYKRDLGQASYSRAIGGELLPVEVVEACLIKKLTADLAAQGLANPAAVLSIPASFNQAQRRARLDAARLAGLEALGTINDPLAAAIAHAESLGYLSPGGGDRPGVRVLVFDLGGGKLDVSIVEIKPQRLRTMAITGNAQLGGRDFDVRLADYLAGEFEKQFGTDPRHDMTSVRRLLESAKDTRHALTARQQARVPLQRDEQSTAVTVTREIFEDLVIDLLDECARVAQAALAQSGMAWRDVGQLLAVGGAARMPCVIRRLKDLTGLDPTPGVHGDEAVARGAALVAEQLLAERESRQPRQKTAITDLTVHTLGFEWNDPQTDRQETVVLVRRGSELPCGTVAKATTNVANQSTLVVQLLEGESRMADECTRIAQLTIGDLPAPLAKGTQVDVHYQFTAGGRLQVKAQLARSGQALPVSVRRAQGLSESQMSDWKQLVARGGGLKAIHALLPKHEQEREQVAAASSAATPAPPPPAPGAEPPIEHFALDAEADPSAARRKKRKMTPRKLAIMIGGYLASALVGTAIGYYILMRIDPSYNWWHLRLPGLRQPPAASAGAR
jgi:molecular chaperone DnaK